MIQQHKISVMRKESRSESQKGDKASKEKVRVNESLVQELAFVGVPLLIFGLFMLFRKVDGNRNQPLLIATEV